MFKSIHTSLSRFKNLNWFVPTTVTRQDPGSGDIQDELYLLDKLEIKDHSQINPNLCEKDNPDLTAENIHKKSCYR